MVAKNVAYRYSLCGFVSGLTLVILFHLFTFKTIETRQSYDSENFQQRKPRILCWIPTIPTNYKTRVLAVQETWGPDCDVILFFSETSDVTIPVIGLGIPEGREYLINKTVAALRYIHKNYFDKVDWFLKADDDTYVFVDNLRHFLSMKNPDAPFYYGSIFSFKNSTYNSGGAGYVFGRHILQRIITNIGKTSRCTFNDRPEDMALGECLESLGVVPGDSTDKQGLEVFHWSNVKKFVKGLQSVPNWVPLYQSFWKSPNIVSNVTATFHFLFPGDMRAWHFLHKHITVAGYRRHRWY